MEEESGVEEIRPRGTVFILVVFAALIIVLWTSVYLILISRGITV